MVGRKPTFSFFFEREINDVCEVDDIYNMTA